MKTTRNFLNIFDSVLSIILCANVGEKLNERVNVSVGRGSRHRTLGCDVRSAGHSRGLVHTAPRESMGIFSRWVIVCGSCRSFVACCRKGCPRLCTKFQPTGSTRTVRTSPCPGFPLLSQLEVLRHTAAAVEVQCVCRQSDLVLSVLIFQNYHFIW